MKLLSNLTPGVSLIIRKVIFLITFSTCVFKANSQVKVEQTLQEPQDSTFAYWLRNSWLNNAITFSSTEFSNNKYYLTLYLGCKNDCSPRWENLKQSFDSTSNISFEEYLINKASFLLEIRRDSLVVEIYNSTEEFESPCFARIILYKDSLSIFKANCKELYSKATLGYEKFNPIFLMKDIKVSSIDKKASDLLESIYKKCQSYFNPKGKISKSYFDSHSMTFDVRNLKNEVIKKAGLNPFNTVEVLRITITCNFQSHGVLFSTSIDGKFASSLFKPNNLGAYHDMETSRYKQELQSYINEFANTKLINWLR